MKNLLFLRGIIKISLGLLFVIALPILLDLIYYGTYSSVIVMPGWRSTQEIWLLNLITLFYFVSVILIMIRQRLAWAFFLILLCFLERESGMLSTFFLPDWQTMNYPFSGLFFSFLFYISLCLYLIFYWPGKNVLLIALIIRELTFLAKRCFLREPTDYLYFAELLRGVEWIYKLLWFFALAWFLIFYINRFIRSIQANPSKTNSGFSNSE